MLVADVVVKMPQDHSNIISAILSGMFLIIGALLAYYGTHRSNQVQKEITKMKIDERLIAENKLNWSNETRKLIAQFIRKCFELNQIIEKANLVNERVKLSSDNSLPVKKRRELLNLTQQDKADLKTAMNGISEAIEIVAEIRLHVFDYEDHIGNSLLERIIEVEQHYTKFEKIPNSELTELTELARQYFEKQWVELTQG